MKQINTFNDIVGNEDIKEMLHEAIVSSKTRNTALDHVFIYGPSGCGKSTFAEVISKELNVPYEKIMCSAIANNGQILNSKILKMQEGSILFLDEIHALKLETMESIYEYLESGKIQQRLPDRILRINAKKITIIAATTEFQSMPTPFINRFPIQVRLNHYTPVELSKIIKLNASSENMELTEDAIETISIAARGVPRNVQQFIRRIRDHSISKGLKIIDQDNSIKALSLMGVDRYGLNNTDRQILTVMLEVFNLAPVGLSALANQIGENESVITKLHEPHLLKTGLITRTSRGRALTEKGIEIAQQYI